MAGQAPRRSEDVDDGGGGLAAQGTGGGAVLPQVRRSRLAHAAVRPAGDGRGGRRRRLGPIPPLSARHALCCQLCCSTGAELAAIHSAAPALPLPASGDSRVAVQEPRSRLLVHADDTCCVAVIRSAARPAAGLGVQLCGREGRQRGAAGKVRTSPASQHYGCSSSWVNVAIQFARACSAQHDGVNGPSPRPPHCLPSSR